jgi:2-methylcitrate dehydratase PrpD
MSSATGALAAFAADLTFEDLPERVRHQAVRAIYDALICAVASSASPTVKLFNRILFRLGGPRQSSVIPSGRRTSAPVASFLNSVAIHARDLDDNLLYHSRTGNTVIPAALSLAEQHDRSGAELIASVVAGYEVAGRVSLSTPGLLSVQEGPNGLQLAMPNPHGMSHNTLGAAAAAGRALKLAAPEMAHALGLAAYTAPVPSLRKALAAERFSNAKPGMSGWQTWSGTLAAILAADGVQADDTALDGPTGFWRMIGASEFDEDVLRKDLGKQWLIKDVTFKLEPAGTWMRPAIRALRTALKQAEVRTADIEKIDVFLHPLGGSVFNQAKPLTELDTQVSYYYLLAVVALKIQPQQWQTRRVYRSMAVREMMNRIELHQDEVATDELRRQINTPPHRAIGALTTVQVRAGGKVFVAQSRYGDGDPWDPNTRASDADLDQKFVRFAAPLLGSAGDHVPNLIWRLPGAASVRPLIHALCRRGD